MTTTILQQYFIPRLGSGEYKTLDVESILKWHAALTELCRGTPKVEAELQILHHAVSGEVLRALPLTFAEFPVVEYPADLNLNGTTPYYVTRRKEWHDTWMAAVLTAVGCDKSSVLIKSLRAVKLKSSGPEGRTTLTDVAEFITKITTIFTHDPTAEERANPKEIYQAVRAGIPLHLRTCVDSKKPTDPDFRDTWETMVRRLSATVKHYEDNEADMRAVEGAKKKAAKTTDEDPTETRKINFSAVAVAKTAAEARLLQRKARQAWQRQQNAWKKRLKQFEVAEEPAVTAATTDKSHITCFNCGEKGHYANECPNAAAADAATVAEASKRGGRGGGKGKKGGKGRGGGKKK